MDAEKVRDDLWDIWPQVGRRRTEAKAKLLERVSKILDAGHDAFEICAAARSYIRSLDDPKFCIGINVWLNNERWEAEIGDAPADVGKVADFEVPKRWGKATGRELRFLERLHELNVNDYTLNSLYDDNFFIIRDGDGCATVVVESPRCQDLVHQIRDKMLLMNKVNPIAWTKAFYEHRKRKSGLRNEAESVSD